MPFPLLKEEDSSLDQDYTTCKLHSKFKTERVQPWEICDQPLQVATLSPGPVFLILQSNTLPGYCFSKQS